LALAVHSTVKFGRGENGFWPDLTARQRMFPQQNLKANGCSAITQFIAHRDRCKLYPDKIDIAQTTPRRNH
jgi:hypothetical protein